MYFLSRSNLELSMDSRFKKEVNLSGEMYASWRADRERPEAPCRVECVPLSVYNLRGEILSLKKEEILIFFPKGEKHSSIKLFYFLDGVHIFLENLGQNLSALHFFTGSQKQSKNKSAFALCGTLSCKT